MPTDANAVAVNYPRAFGRGTGTDMQCPHCKNKSGLGYGVGSSHFPNGHVTTEHGAERLWRCYVDHRHLFLGPASTPVIQNEKLNAHFVKI